MLLSGAGLVLLVSVGKLSCREEGYFNFKAAEVLLRYIIIHILLSRCHVLNLN